MTAVRSAVRPVAGSLDAGMGKLGALVKATGIPSAVLQRLAVDVNATPEKVIALVKERVGSRAWNAAAVAGSLPARAVVLLDAIDGTARRAAPAPRAAPERDEEEDDDVCTCGHDRATHERGAGPCMACKCNAFEDEDEDDMPQTKSTPRTSAHTPSMEARIEAAKTHPSVVKLFRNPSNTHSLAALAEGWIKAVDEQARALAGNGA